MAEKYKTCKHSTGKQYEPNSIDSKRSRGNRYTGFHGMDSAVRQQISQQFRMQ